MDESCNCRTGIKQPFPKWISQQGWALIQDKHHQDESTDRYVPLTAAFIKQIQVLRGLMRMLGIKLNHVLIYHLMHCNFVILIRLKV